MEMDKTIVIALTSSINLANEVVTELGIPLGKSEVKHFADGEIMVELGESVRGKHVYIIQSTCNPVSSNLMEVLIAIDACKRASASHITVIMPYFGYARQDRKARPRQPITSKLVASLLETAGANRVITMELHATQIQGFFDIPADDISAISIIGKYFQKKDLGEIVVVSPDHGGVTRARRLAEILHAPIAIIDKRRPKPNVAEAMNLIGEVDGKTAIIVDDIVDTAGTLVSGIQMLRDKGAKAIVVAHEQRQADGLCVFLQAVASGAVFGKGMDIRIVPIAGQVDAVGAERVDGHIRAGRAADVHEQLHNRSPLDVNPV